MPEVTPIQSAAHTRFGSNSGQPLTRRDGILKVTGRATFAADNHPDGMLYAVHAVSTIARGRVTRLEVEAAKAHPGVVEVITPANRPALAGDPEAKAHTFAFRIAVLPDLYVNAGGVVVSYFEWVKNLTHIPFGLMERRHHEASHQILARSLEAMTGAIFPFEKASSFLEGAREIDLVRSGLDDIMRSAYAQIRGMWHDTKEIPDLRTAAYAIAIRRCAEAYGAIGI